MYIAIQKDIVVREKTANAQKLTFFQYIKLLFFSFTPIATYLKKRKQQTGVKTAGT